MKDSKETLDMLKKYLEQAKTGDLDTGDFIDPKLSSSAKADRARDIAGMALADDVLKNSPIPMPSKGATRSQVEDYLARVMKERYPELEPDIKVKPDLDFSDATGKKLRALGLYYPGRKAIELDQDMVKSSPRGAVSTLFHEAGHQYEDVVLEAPYYPERDSAKLVEEIEMQKRINPDLDPSEMARTKFRGHHVQIPGLRDDKIFELGALKSYLKSGKFRSMLPGAVGAGVGAALAGSASDALAEAVVPGGVDSVGEGSDEVLDPEQQQSVEASRELTGGAPLNQARLRALQRMLRK